MNELTEHAPVVLRLKGAPKKNAFHKKQNSLQAVPKRDQQLLSPGAKNQYPSARKSKQLPQPEFIAGYQNSKYQKSQMLKSLLDNISEQNKLTKQILDHTIIDTDELEPRHTID